MSLVCSFRHHDIKKYIKLLEKEGHEDNEVWSGRSHLVCSTWRGLRDLILVYNILTRRSRKADTDLFTLATSDRT